MYLIESQDKSCFKNNKLQVYYINDVTFNLFFLNYDLIALDSRILEIYSTLFFIYLVKINRSECSILILYFEIVFSKLFLKSVLKCYEVVG